MAVEVALLEGILRIRFTGTVSPADLVRLADEVLAVEARMSPAPDRVSDLTAAESFGVGFDEFFEMVRRRRASALAHAIRSALVASSPVQVGLARMFQTLNDDPRVTVRIFSSMESALAWLAASAPTPV